MAKDHNGLFQILNLQLNNVCEFTSLVAKDRNILFLFIQIRSRCIFPLCYSVFWHFCPGLRPEAIQVSANLSFSDRVSFSKVIFGSNGAISISSLVLRAFTLLVIFIYILLFSRLKTLAFSPSHDLRLYLLHVFFCFPVYESEHFHSHVVLSFRNTNFFPTRVRVLLSDFAVIIAIVTFVLIDWSVSLATPKLEVPYKFEVSIELNWISQIIVTCWQYNNSLQCQYDWLHCIALYSV